MQRSDGSSSTELTRSDSEAGLWTDILRIFPPQWNYRDTVHQYLDSVTLPLVPPGKSYKYHVFIGDSDLGSRPYGRNADGSQIIDFLASDDAHIRVLAVSPSNGKETLVAEWDPQDKPLANIESEYGRRVREGGIEWTKENSLMTSVTLKSVLTDQDYRFRVFCGNTDLGTRSIRPSSIDKTLTINFKEYTKDLDLLNRSPIKVLVVDTEGNESLITGWWPLPTVSASGTNAPGEPESSLSTSAPDSSIYYSTSSVSPFNSIPPSPSLPDPLKLLGVPSGFSLSSPTPAHPPLRTPSPPSIAPSRVPTPTAPSRLASPLSTPPANTPPLFLPVLRPLLLLLLLSPKLLIPFFLPPFFPSVSASATPTVPPRGRVQQKPVKSASRKSKAKVQVS